MAISKSIRIHVSHLGFCSNDSSKRAAISGFPVSDPIPFRVIDVGSSPYRSAYEGRAQNVKCDFGCTHIADFSDLKEPGMYQVIAGDASAEDLQYLAEEPRDTKTLGPAFSPPFAIRDDLYLRPIRMALDFITTRRSGTTVVGYHSASHLDDGVKDDNGEHLDTVGGWYEGGSLRKGLWPNLVTAFSLVQIIERMDIESLGLSEKPNALVEELKFVFPFLLKMQDSKTGVAYMDVAGGERRDNADNRWTDNVLSDDDRKIRTEYDPWVQGLYIATLAAMARLLPSKADQKKAKTAAVRCADALPDMIEPEVIAQSATIIGLSELIRLDAATKKRFTPALLQIGDQLIDLQETRPTGSLTGFFLSDERRDDFHRHHGLSGAPLIALARLVSSASGKNQIKWRQALNHYVKGVLMELVKNNAFGAMPYGLYRGQSLGEYRRDLGAGLNYRYFMSPYRDLLRHRPLRKLGMEHGTNAHLLSTAAGLLEAAAVLQEKNLPEQCRRVAEDQVRWVFGFNPLDISFMTGVGLHNPYPHSRFIGQSTGGIMLGAIGGPDDIAWVENLGLMDWRTCEYWIVNNAWFLWYSAWATDRSGSGKKREPLSSVGVAARKKEIRVRRSTRFSKD